MPNSIHPSAIGGITATGRVNPSQLPPRKCPRRRHGRSRPPSAEWRCGWHGIPCLGEQCLFHQDTRSLLPVRRHRRRSHDVASDRPARRFPTRTPGALGAATHRSGRDCSGKARPAAPGRRRVDRREHRPKDSGFWSCLSPAPAPAPGCRRRGVCPSRSRRAPTPRSAVGARRRHG